jgi:hypothetical protein
MTDRVRSVIVTFDREYRTDDLETLVSAIEQLRFVSGVEPIVDGVDGLFARAQVRAQLRVKVLTTINELFDEGGGK